MLLLLVCRPKLVVEGAWIIDWTRLGLQCQTPVKVNPLSLLIDFGGGSFSCCCSCSCCDRGKTKSTPSLKTEVSTLDLRPEFDNILLYYKPLQNLVHQTKVSCKYSSLLSTRRMTAALYQSKCRYISIYNAKVRRSLTR